MENKKFENNINLYSDKTILKEHYKRLLVDMADQMATILADGKAIEVDRSRSGLKMYSFRRRHEIVQRQQNEATPSRE